MIIKIDRMLDSVIKRDADAVAFRAGDVPRFYMNGKSLPVACVDKPLAEEDVLAVAKSLFPGKSLEALENGRATSSFNYGESGRFIIEAEQGTEGLRVIIWHRKNP